MNSNHYVAIMAGGIGSRFWPMSRSSYPKQFLDILGLGRTLIQQSYDRYSKVVPPENVFVVTSAEYVSIVKKQLPDLPPENILAEPSRKNTAACIAYIAFKLQTINLDAVMIAAPADHLVTETTQFVTTAQTALQFVEQNNALVTIGIKPSHPNTGYGYIQHEMTTAAPEVFKVKTFTEKPSEEALEKHLSEVFEVFAAERSHFNTEGEQKAIEKIYPLCTNTSIDVGVMEKASNVYVIPADFGWSDLGTWNSAWDNMEKDYFGNAVVGKQVMVVDANNCVVHVPDNKLVLLQGLRDYIIVDTPDALLICKKEKEQQIKEYVAEVKRNMGDQYL